MAGHFAALRLMPSSRFTLDVRTLKGRRSGRSPRSSIIPGATSAPSSAASCTKRFMQRSTL